MKQTLKQKLQSIKYNQNNNLYEHLVNVLRRMLLESPHDAYNMFEEYSLAVAKKELIEKKYVKETYQELKQYINSIQGLLNKPNVGTEEDPAEPGPAGFVPSHLEEGKWFEMTGVGFGQTLTYKIHKSLQRFSILKNIQQVRFWGKIFGQTNDYYVAEGQGPAQQVEGGENAEGEGAQEPSPNIEPRGQGINKRIYWVTTNLASDWVELPVVTPEQMIISRKLKYIFTGDLQVPICRNPHFPGKQAHLLKCQILRITASCTIIPKTMYKIVEQQPDSNDNAEIEKTQEWKFPDFESLSHLENWVHHPANILLNGRMTHLPPPPAPQDKQVPEDYEQQMKKTIRLKDPFQSRLKPISQDKYKQIPGWKISIHGDSTTYKALAKQGVVNYGFISVKSNIWRGYTHIYHNKKYTNIYIGNGFKSSDLSYFPSLPSQILTQKKDQLQQPEPNFIPQLQEPNKQDGQIEGKEEGQPEQDS